MHDATMASTKYDTAGLDEILTLDETAKFLKISRVYAGMLVRQGIPGLRPPLPHIRFDRIIRIDKNKLRAWLAAAPGEAVKRGRGRPRKQVQKQQVVQQ